MDDDALQQILTVAQMRAAEDALIAKGSSVDALMQIAGRGAAEWVWRVAMRHPVTVLCGPGNNGGDGYVIAEAVRQRGGKVCVIAASDPATDAAKNARMLYQGDVYTGDAAPAGEIFVDCLFGSGLTRPLLPEHQALLTRLANTHRYRIAIDVPGGVQSDTGALLGDAPKYDLTLALGAWKFAHFLMPSGPLMGDMRLVSIGADRMPGAAKLIDAPRLRTPDADAHKYRRGLLAIVAGAMPGAALLAAKAAQGSGAGYVKLYSDTLHNAPVELVTMPDLLSGACIDERTSAILVGPGLGRDDLARGRLHRALATPMPVVIDADGLILLTKEQATGRKEPVIATPHDGELAALEETFGVRSAGSRVERVQALALASNMTILAKGPDTVIAAPDGRTACARRGSSWLSVAGTGDVLAGIVASRLACGLAPFDAACEAVWLHGKAARLTPVPFHAGELASHVRGAFAACITGRS